jgi:PAS domain S-box-containing protein
MREKLPSVALSFAFGIGVALAAIAARRLLDPWIGNDLPLVTLFAAVAAAVWFGGYRPAVAAALVGYVGCDYLFIEPRGSLGLSVRGLSGLIAYLIWCAIIIGFGEALRRTRREARVQRDRLQVTLGSIGDAVITTDPAGNVVDLNAVAEALTGWSRGEAAGRPIDAVFRIVDEDTRAPVESPALRALRQGVVVGLANHTILIAKDGSDVPIDDSAAPIRDVDGSIAGCVLVFRDMTERRAAENRVRRNERELSDFFENASVGLHSVGPDGTILRVNKAELELLGYAREEYVGRHIAEFHADRPVVDDILACLTRGATLRDRPARLRCKDGSIRDVLIDSNVLFEDGKFVHTRCFTRDVTAQKRAEDALRASQQAESALRAELEALLRAAPAAIWVAHDPDFRRMTGNPAAARMLRLSDADAPPCQQIPPHVEIYRNGEPVGIDDLPMHTAARTGQPVPNQELEFRFEDGSACWAYGNAVPLFDAAEKVRGVISTFVDITERKLAEAALKEDDRRKDVFLATLAHELRNPLAPLRSSLEIMKRSGGDARRIDAALDTMGRQISHMERLIDDLLDVSRITHNRLELRIQQVELASVLQHALEASRPLAEASGHEVVLELPEAPLEVRGDPVRLAQVFGNLLNNAFKYTEPGGRIEVGIERLGAEGLVSVRDNGIGIDPLLMPRIFEMFGRADRDLERSQGGLGIGLTLVKQLVEMHGGKVEAASRGRGHGSVFRVRLPVVETASGERAAGRIASAPASTARRILVVDDNKDAAESLAMLLALEGNDTQLAFDGIEAVEAVEQHSPDIVLLDIGLPRLNGFDACRRMRQRPAGARAIIVALTGWGHEEDRRATSEAGFDDHLVKPVDYAALMQLLATLETQRRDAGRG